MAESAPPPAGELAEHADDPGTPAEEAAIEYSVVIPVYRAADTLQELCERLGNVLGEISPAYEIILVDDGSPDDSWRVMTSLREQNPRIRILQHMRNFGQHEALLSGMECSRGEFVITMDDDLQHPPEEIPKLVEAIRADDAVDVVMGAYKVKQHSWFRNLGTRVINAVVSYVFNKDRNLKLTSFRIIRRPVVAELTLDRSQCPRIGQLLLMITNRIRNIPVEHHARRHGQSGYTFRKLVATALDNILSNSSLPLQVVSYLGFGSAFLSMVLTVYYLAKYFIGGVSVPGWTTVVLLLLFFFGAVMFSFGVVGEYLIRILRETKAPPRRIVRRKHL